MPTFTAIALDSLLEPGSRNPKPNSKPPPPPVRLPPKPISEKKNIPPRPIRAASPILYATPDVTPLPDSPLSFPSSPYIINHKRRGPRLLKSLSQNDVAMVSETLPSDPECEIKNEGETDVNDVLKDGVNGSESCEENGLGNGNGEEKTGVGLEVEVERDAEMEDLLEFQDSMSVTSNTDADADERLGKPSTPVGEYYDAFEEISSDGTTRSSYRNVEDELHEMRLNVLTEIEKRKQAEEALENYENQWKILSEKLSLIGFTIPTLQPLADNAGEETNIDPAQELCRQIVIARAVADSVARGYSRAVVEMEFEPQIESKNFEIARLWDRLQYYEAATREMSQRNQEAVERARQHRHRRKRRQRWIWGSVGLVATLGAAAIAYSCLPASKSSSSSSSSHEVITDHND